MNFDLAQILKSLNTVTSRVSRMAAYGARLLAMSSMVAFALTLFAAFALPVVVRGETAGRVTPRLCRDLFLAAPSRPEAADAGSGLKIFSASHSLSQKIRDNTRDQYQMFLDLLHDQVAKPGSDVGPDRLGESVAADYKSNLSAYARFIGWIKGDNHLGNYVALPRGKKLDIFFVDIKDGGRGPLILDVARLFVTTYAISRDIPRKDFSKVIVENYLAGLNGETIGYPKSIQKLLSSESLEKYEAELESYVKRKTQKGDHDRVFRFRPDVLKPLESKTEVQRHEQQRIWSEMQASIWRQDAGAKILDVGVRPRDRGGGRDLKRYWALVRGSDGQIKIVEFKEIGEPASALVAEQTNDVTRMRELEKLEWGDADLGYVEVPLTDKDFTMRPKKVDVLTVPYKVRSQEDLDFIRDYLIVASYLTGRSHGLQSVAVRYRATIYGQLDPKYSGLSKNDQAEHERESIKKFRKVLREYAKDYLRDFKERYNISEHNLSDSMGSDPRIDREADGSDD